MKVFKLYPNVEGRKYIIIRIREWDEKQEINPIILNRYKKA